MVKTSESVIKTVNVNKRKWLLRLNQKVQEEGVAFRLYALVTHKLPGRMQAPNPAHFVAWNVETPYRSLRDSRLQSLPMAMWAWEVGKSEGQTVIVWIRVATSPGTKVSPRPTGLTS